MGGVSSSTAAAAVATKIKNANAVNFMFCSLPQAANDRFKTMVSGGPLPGIGPTVAAGRGLARASLPRLQVRQKHPLQTIAKRPTDAQHRRKVISPRTYHKLSLVGSTGNLV